MRVEQKQRPQAVLAASATIFSNRAGPQPPRIVPGDAAPAELDAGLQKPCLARCWQTRSASSGPTFS